MSGALVQSLFAICMTVSQSGMVQDSAALTVEVVNIEEVKGGILFAVYSSADDYMNPDRACLMARVEVDSTVTTWNCKLPKGDYAIAIFHDIDDNEELNTSRVGFPQEPYGFSNNARGMFGPPNFKDSSFDLQSDLSISIKIR